VALASAIADASGDHPMMMTTEKATFDVTAEAEPVIAEPEDSNVKLAGTVSTVSSLVPLPRRSTRCIPLKELALSDPERRKVDRYLDVTKSALLFGGRVLLVEGIAEALLLPVIAKKYVLKQDQEKFRIFRSAVFVPIDGVDFVCYLRLLLTAYNDIRIADRVVVITDGDRINHAPGVLTPGELRKIDYETIANELLASGVLHVSINTYSLETELVNAGNGALLKGVYLELHPKSEAKWDAAVALTGDAGAAAVQGLFENTPKGDFAQLLAEAIREGDSFNVPPYLRTAIENVVQ
jgi:putative ATP-dependent endonuclease of OLD family